METRTETTVSAELEALEAAVREAEQRRDQVGVDRSAANRELRAAEDARLALEEQRAAGEEVADKALAAAVEEIEKAREVADARVWNARRDGGDRAVREAEEALRRFGREHFAELAAEEVPLDEPARAALQDAWATLDAAASTYALRVRRWHQLAEYGGIDPRDIPGNPLRGDETIVRQRFASGIETPTPRSLRR